MSGRKYLNMVLLLFSALTTHWAREIWWAGAVEAAQCVDAGRSILTPGW